MLFVDGFHRRITRIFLHHMRYIFEYFFKKISNLNLDVIELV